MNSGEEDSKKYRRRSPRFATNADKPFYGHGGEVARLGPRKNLPKSIKKAIKFNDVDKSGNESDGSVYTAGSVDSVSSLAHHFEKRLKIKPRKKIDKEKFGQFCTWSKYDEIQSSSYGTFIKSVNDQLFHLDHVEKSLDLGLQKLLKDRESSILALYGKQGNGKRSIINQVFAVRDDVKFVVLDGKFAKVLDVKKSLKMVKSSSDEKEPLVFVLYDFDKLMPSFVNKVLYSLVDELQKKLTLLILVSERQNAFESIEKRIVSRVGQNSVKCMDERLTSNDCWNLVHQIIETALENCEDNIKGAFKLPSQPPKYFDRLCNRLPCYAQLKLFVKELADEIFDSIEQKSDKSIKSMMKRILTPTDTVVARLNTLTDRMHGLLIAAALSTSHVSKKIEIGSVFREYKKFLNTYHVTSKPFQLDEAEFRDDIEYIVYQRFWADKRQNGKIASITWLEDPLKLLSEKYHNYFNGPLEYWLKSDLKDDSKLR